MTIYFHAGTPKTATTGLQVFLARNREKLEEHNYVFPKFLGDTNHVRLTYYGRDGGTIPPNLVEPGLNKSEGILAFRQRMEEEFKTEVTPGRDYILSNEHWGVSHTADEIRRILSLLTSTGQDVKVIMYFREPSEYFGSMYSTNLKHGNTRDLDKPDERSLNRRYNYLLICDRWARLVGEKNVTARLFVQEKLHKQNLIDDFLSLIGVPEEVTDSLERKDEPLNKSLDYLIAGFLLELNKRIPRIIEDGVNFERKGLPELCQSISRREAILVPEEIRGWIREHLEGDLSEFNAKYLGGDEEWPFPPYSEANRKPVQTPTQEEMVEIFCEFWRMQKYIKQQRLKSKL